ncbi:MAG: DNA-processing protein DprA [Gammaproteobacteria bacterium]|nr:DNA-processing protein DprA [Gammaproteobacteria bacterium]
MAATSSTQNSDDTLTDWLILHHAPGIGAVTIHQLLEHYSGPAAARRMAAHQGLGLEPAALNFLQQPDQERIERDLAWAEQPGNHIITCRDPRYPGLLLQIADPPPLLYVHGNVEALGQLQLAMVGSRNPTASGQRTATEFARYLALAGLTITSGLALGIDAASHQGALDVGKSTIAVMGTGLDRVYPSRHRELAHVIAEHGALVSEFPVGTAPKPENFPRRNRIISGLSLGILVVEAAIRSGSLISARCAGEQGREVFAIPGSIHNPLARGCHALIRQGAKLVETAQDIIDELGALAGACAPPGPQTHNQSRVPAPELSADYLQLLDSIGYDPTSVDALVETSGLTPAVVSSMLLQLEMSGYLASSAGGLYNRLK